MRPYMARAERKTEESGLRTRKALWESRGPDSGGKLKILTNSAETTPKASFERIYAKCERCYYIR